MENKIRNADVKFGQKEVSANLQHFIKSLLTVEIVDRLGTSGLQEIQDHPWLKKVSFEKIVKKV